jgi:hypothetical protein
MKMLGRIKDRRKRKAKKKSARSEAKTVNQTPKGEDQKKESPKDDKKLSDKEDAKHPAKDAQTISQQSDQEDLDLLDAEELLKLKRSMDNGVLTKGVYEVRTWTPAIPQIGYCRGKLLREQCIGIVFSITRNRLFLIIDEV